MAPGLSSAMLLDLRLCSSWGSVLAAAETRRGVSGGEQDERAIDSTVTKSGISQPPENSKPQKKMYTRIRLVLVLISPENTSAFLISLIVGLK